MKVFVAAFLAVAASASPVWYQPSFYGHPGLTYGHQQMVTPLVQQYNPITSYYQPLAKPVVPAAVHTPVAYVKDDKINVEKTQDEKVKVYKTEEVKPMIYGHPFGFQQQPIVQQYQVDSPAKYSAKNGEVEHTVYKREADADAKPFWNFSPYTGAYGMTYSQGLPYAHHGMIPAYTTYNTVPFVNPAVQAVVPQVTYKKPEITSDAKVVANDAVKPFGYAEKGNYVADSEGALHIAKRDAESQFIGYNPHMASPYTFSPYMTHYTKPVVPSVYHAKPIVPGMYHQQPAFYTHSAGFPQLKVKSYSNDAVKAEDYASKGQYHAETAGSVHIAKRDAEADAQVFTHPLSLSTYAVGSAYQAPFVRAAVPATYTHSFYNRGLYNNYYY